MRRLIWTKFNQFDVNEQYDKSGAKNNMVIQITISHIKIIELNSMIRKETWDNDDHTNEQFNQFLMR